LAVSLNVAWVPTVPDKRKVGAGVDRDQPLLCLPLGVECGLKITLAAITQHLMNEKKRMTTNTPTQEDIDLTTEG